MRAGTCIHVAVAFVSTALSKINLVFTSIRVPRSVVSSLFWWSLTGDFIRPKVAGPAHHVELFANASQLHASVYWDGDGDPVTQLVSLRTSGDRISSRTGFIPSVGHSGNIKTLRHG